MTWQRLLASRSVAAHTTSVHEMNSFRSIVERDLRDAALTELSADRSFGIAYGAVLILAKMAIAASGYRVKGEGGHWSTFQALEIAMGPSVGPLCTYFDACRKKRNRITYDVAGSVSDLEADEIRGKATEFQKVVESWIHTNHPSLT